MPIGPITAVRVFQNLKNLALFASGQRFRSWFDEQLTSLKAPELGANTATLDGLAAVAQTASLRQQHTDAYAMQRDHLYANRSRRWLYSRAVVGKIDQNYAVWASFVRMGMDLNLKQFLTADPDQLAVEPVKELLELT